MIEVGNNTFTRTSRVLVADASATFSYIPGVRLRVGQFKLPLMDETLESQPLAATTINYSQVASQLVSENPVASGAYTGGSSGTRDVGIQAFESIPVGPVELSYAAMLSNGQPGVLDATTPKDWTGRMMVSRVFDGARNDPHRREVSVFGWRQQGARALDGVEGLRVRQGGGIHVETVPVRARVEVVHAVGMIEAGASPPFPGQPIEVVVDGEAIGGTAMLRGAWRGFGASTRYDQLWRDTGSETDLRVFQTLALGLDYSVTPRARIMAELELRSLRAPGAGQDSQTIADTMGDRLSAQAVVVF